MTRSDSTNPKNYLSKKEEVCITQASSFIVEEDDNKNPQVVNHLLTPCVVQL